MVAKNIFILLWKKCILAIFVFKSFNCARTKLCDQWNEYVRNIPELWACCDDITGPEALTTGLDSTLIAELFDVCCSIVGWCDLNDELMSLLGSDALVVVVVGGGELRTS